MSSDLADTLKRLRARAHAPVEGPFNELIDSVKALSPLRTRTAELKALARKDRPLHPSIVKSARGKWAHSKSLERFTPREVRALCGENDIATDPHFVQAIGGLGVLHQRRRWLELLIAMYLERWRSMVAPEEIERLLRTAVRGFKGRSRRINPCQAEPERLFSEETANWLADNILERRVAPAIVFDEWSFGLATGLAKATLNAAVQRWGAKVRDAGAKLSREQAELDLSFLTETLLVSDQISQESASIALSAIVMSPVGAREPVLKATIKEYVTDLEKGGQRFGDPRLPANSGNWALVPKEARETVASWFSEEDLEFFFKHCLPEYADPHGRRAFWSRYLRQVIDCRVVLSTTDDIRLRSRMTKRMSYAKMDGSSDTSAFIMRFRGASELIIIEFSKSGNAIRIHDGERFRYQVGDMRKKHAFHHTRDLKRDSTTLDKYNHHAGWERHVSNFLAKYSIRRSG